MKIKVARTPTLPGQKKTGDDDLIKAKGPRAFAKVLEKASAAPALGGPITMNFPLGSEIEPRAVEYLIHPFVPKGQLSGVKGDPGSCKTFGVLSWAASLSRGCVPMSGMKCAPVTTLYISCESDAETSTMPRFLAMGGDPTRFRPFVGAIGADGKARTFTVANFEAIEASIKEHDAGLVILDPLQSFLGANVDMHRANETRPLLDGLAGVAKRTGAAIIIVRHLAKSSGGRSVHSGLGSIDIVGAVRSEMLIGSAPDNPNNRAMVHDKANSGPRGPSLAFTLEPVTIAGADGKQIATARVKWLGETTLTAADLRAPEVREGTKKATALAYLLGALTHGPRAMKELEGESGYDEQTLQRAKRASGGRVVNAGYDKDRRRMWALSPVGANQKFAGKRITAKQGEQI